MNVVLLLTACVNPRGMSFTVLQDTSERERQYRKALDFYLQETPYKIVFCENTLCNFSKDYEVYIKSGRLEYLTFDGNNYDKTLGKGYGEALIIQYALEHSKFIGDDSFIVKITGRLIVKNTCQLINYTVRNSNNKIIATTLRAKNKLSYSVFFISNKLFLVQYFLKNINKINDTEYIYFEHVLYQAILKWKMDGHKCKLFWLPIIIYGISGSTNRPYMTKKNMIYTRAFARFLIESYRLYHIL